jgi:hypothetical protein
MKWHQWATDKWGQTICLEREIPEPPLAQRTVKPKLPAKITTKKTTKERRK